MTTKTEITGANIRPIIRWAGSKRQLVPELKKWVPANIRTYIEPFAGSACLFLSIRPSHAILGDINAELMLTYRQLRRNPTALHSAVAAIERTPRQYYRQRAKRPEDLTAFERATRFIYLNRNCFNAVYRVNNRGEFNVPWGTRTGTIPKAEEFRAVALALRKAELHTDDFEAVMARATTGDFVYLDPPYSTSAADEPGLFGANAFTRKDLQRLVQATHRLNDVGAMFLLSFEYDKKLLTELSPSSWKIVSARRHVAGFSGARRKVKELLFTNLRDPGQ